MNTKRNKGKLIENLKEKTHRTDEECNIIYEILQEQSIIGRKNKEIIKSKFMEKLNIEESEADELYNISMETILKDFFKIK